MSVSAEQKDEGEHWTVRIESARLLLPRCDEFADLTGELVIIASDPRDLDTLGRALRAVAHRLAPGTATEYAPPLPEPHDDEDTVARCPACGHEWALSREEALAALLEDERRLSKVRRALELMPSPAS